MGIVPVTTSSVQIMHICLVYFSTIIVVYFSIIIYSVRWSHGDSLLNQKRAAASALAEAPPSSGESSFTHGD